MNPSTPTPSGFYSNHSRYSKYFPLIYCPDNIRQRFSLKFYTYNPKLHQKKKKKSCSSDESELNENDKM